MNMAIVHDIVLMLLYGCLCLLFSIVVAIPLYLLLQVIGDWLAYIDFERRHTNNGKKR